ncbi:MAG TPA: serine/threonine-protein kinase [Planctomycetota bacterium]|nr:serine/threonine-protein kinase [Planctomycetota bacterium]
MTSEYSPSPNPDSLSDAFQKALGDYLTRIERDGSVALDEFQRHHPEFADRLGRQLDWLTAHLGRGKEGLPEHIGPYRVVQRLGTGGMGEVYLAEQSSPFQRIVALKVIRTDKVSEGRVARFLQEIQTLASLSHDGIAKVFEAGQDAGRPYFTMEYVPGRPVTDYCSEERLGLRARLRLFTRICAAVEHAHRNGVLHRDLKPSNILVFGRPAESTVKIIDFGLAKIVAAEGETPRSTITGQVLGTPDYMSPEQVAEPGEQHVDTRTDVYSLGAVLYELLTGVLPLSLWRMEHDDIQALLRAIRERQPSSPSVRVEELAEVSSSPATVEGISPHRLSRLLAGDLDAIVMKALAKDVAQRYGSVGELTEDIRRHLHHEPVGARPATARYVLAKFVRRIASALRSPRR